MGALLTSISLLITKYAYPLIPELYSLFIKLSTFQFLDNTYIKSVWNNIYVLVGVIVLFAIAIKLISAIVNPDTLSDNKKGAKSLYFRTVLAVVFIFIIPALFTYSYKLQLKLIDSNFLISRVFGYQIPDDADVGQLLSWTTFSSFCTLGEDADETDREYYRRVSYDMSRFMDELTSRIKSKDGMGGKYNLLSGSTAHASFNYHTLLSPIAGCVVAYEMFLLCMDTLFRAAKLAFLELMLPIILGAFVFNADIIKKWAKEFISTYLSLFLKVLAIGFMVISLVAIRGYVEGDPFFANDQMANSLFNLLFIIALLQLVKKIPELINAIFGVNIKPAGGIKGRLGEMAGIGGLAQKAWTALGTGAKNIGKAVGTGILAAPALAGYAGANAWYKKHHNGKSLSDTEAFRKGKGVLYGARNVVKTGSLMEGYKEYEKMSEPQQHTRKELLGMRARVLNGMDKEGITYDGIWTNERRESDGSIKHKADGKTDYKTRDEIIAENQKTQAQMRRTFSGTSAGRKLIAQNEKTELYDRKYSDALSVQKAGEKVLPFVDSVYKDITSNPGIYSRGEIERISEIKARMDSGERLVTADDANFLKQYMNKESASQFKTVVSKYDATVQTALKDNDFTIQDLITAGALSGTISNAKDAVDRSKSAEQAIVDGMGDADQIAYKEYSAVMEKQNAALVNTNAFNGAFVKDQDLFYVTDSNGAKSSQGWTKELTDEKEAEWLSDAGSAIKGASSATPTPVEESAPQSTSYQSAPAQGSSGLFESSGSNAYGSNQGSTGSYWNRVTGDEERPTSSGPMPWEDYTPIEKNIPEYEARVQELKSKKTLTTEEQVELMMKQNMIDANKKRKNGKPNE